MQQILFSRYEKVKKKVTFGLYNLKKFIIQDKRFTMQSQITPEYI